MKHTYKNIEVTHIDAEFEREKLIRPFGFKGGYLTELWQTAASMKSPSGNSGIGLATQSVLYADADLFAAHTEAAGNALMFAVTDRALQMVKQIPFTTPVALLEKIWPAIITEGRRITGRQSLNINFLYNALVSVDNAAWLLYADENHFRQFDAMIPQPYRNGLSHRHDKIAVMYQVPYGMPVEEIKKAVERGYFVIKIKIGQPGTQAEMLQKDIDRLTEIHHALKGMATDQTDDGRLVYTLDANGRYEKKVTFRRFLDHAQSIGALDRILLAEEPLKEDNDEDVADLGIRIVADESAHDEAGALRRLEQGYGGLVLKGIAKTLSLSMKLARLAHERKVPCLCADLTVNPILINWHQNLAARLAPFPGLEMGMMETNGEMNYRRWQTLLSYNPAGNASWMQVRNGVFELDEEFYRCSGGIFEPSAHYQSIFKRT